MATLEEALQRLHELGKPVEISWLWDGGVDVDAGGEKRSFAGLSDVLPWLQRWYALGGVAKSHLLANELQKIYDSEINVTVRTGGGRIFVGLGNEFTGFEPEGTVGAAAGILVWFQDAIHEKYPASKYDVERLGRTFTPTFVDIP